MTKRVSHTRSEWRKWLCEMARICCLTTGRSPTTQVAIHEPRQRGGHQPEDNAVVLAVFIPAHRLGSDRLLPADAKLKIGLAALSALRQAHQRVDQDGLRIPGNGLVVQGQAGLLIAVVQRVRL